MKPKWPYVLAGLALGLASWGGIALAAHGAGEAVVLCAQRGIGIVNLSESGGCLGDRTAVSVASHEGVEALAAELASLSERVDALQSENASLAGRVEALESENDSLQTLLAGVTRPDPDTLRFSGMNVQLVNGLGSTETTNGLGNLIVGYAENHPAVSWDRSGSHYLVLGIWNGWSSFGGLVAGRFNRATGAFATISGGDNNTADGRSSVVSGGTDGGAIGDFSTVSGGVNNFARGFRSTVSGGRTNIASGSQSTVSGGALNTASGVNSTVSGGVNNTASGAGSTVSGGEGNVAGGTGSHVP